MFISVLPSSTFPSLDIGVKSSQQSIDQSVEYVSSLFESVNCGMTFDV
jgi:hypothetical protein